MLAEFRKTDKARLEKGELLLSPMHNHIMIKNAVLGNVKNDSAWIAINTALDKRLSAAIASERVVASLGHVTEFVSKMLLIDPFNGVDHCSNSIQQLVERNRTISLIQLHMASSLVAMEKVLLVLDDVNNSFLTEPIVYDRYENSKPNETGRAKKDEPIRLLLPIEFKKHTLSEMFLERLRPMDRIAIALFTVTMMRLHEAGLNHVRAYVDATLPVGSTWTTQFDGFAHAHGDDFKKQASVLAAPGLDVVAWTLNRIANEKTDDMLVLLRAKRDLTDNSNN